MLIILAVISINVTIGEDGIIARAEKARQLHSHGEVEDGILMLYMDYQIEQKLDGVLPDGE